MTRRPAMNEVLWRFLPLLTAITFLAVGVGFRSWIQIRRHGSSGFAIAPGRSWTELCQAIALAAFCVLLVGQALAAAFAPDRLFMVLPHGPDADLARWIGTAVALAATALMFAAQLDLGASWRIGID